MKNLFSLYVICLTIFVGDLSALILPSYMFVTTPLTYQIAIKRIDFRKTDLTWHTYSAPKTLVYADITSAAMSGDAVQTYAATTALPEGDYDGVRIVFSPTVKVSGIAWDGSAYTAWTDNPVTLSWFINPENSAAYDLVKPTTIDDLTGAQVAAMLYAVEEIDAVIPVNTDGKTQYGLNGETIDGQYYYHLSITFATGNTFAVDAGGSIPALQVNFDTTSALEFAVDSFGMPGDYALTVAIPLVEIFIDGAQVYP